MKKKMTGESLYFAPGASIRRNILATQCNNVLNGGVYCAAFRDNNIISVIY